MILSYLMVAVSMYLVGVNNGNSDQLVFRCQHYLMVMLSPIIMPVTRPFDRHHWLLPNLRHNYLAKAAIRGHFAITKLIGAYFLTHCRHFYQAPDSALCSIQTTASSHQRYAQYEPVLLIYVD